MRETDLLSIRLFLRDQVMVEGKVEALHLLSDWRQEKPLVVLEAGLHRHALGRENLEQLVIPNRDVIIAYQVYLDQEKLLQYRNLVNQMDHPLCRRNCHD